MSKTMPTVGDDLKVSDIPALILAHYQDNPSHGAGCACLDQLQGTFRRLTTIGNLRERLADDDKFKAQSAVDGLLHNANRWRY